MKKLLQNYHGVCKICLENSKTKDFNNFWKNIGNVPVDAHGGQSHATLTESEQHEAN